MFPTEAIDVSCDFLSHCNIICMVTRSRHQQTLLCNNSCYRQLAASHLAKKPRIGIQACVPTAEVAAVLLRGPLLDALKVVLKAPFSGFFLIHTHIYIHRHRYICYMFYIML